MEVEGTNFGGCRFERLLTEKDVFTEVPLLPAPDFSKIEVILDFRNWRVPARFYRYRGVCETREYTIRVQIIVLDYKGTYANYLFHLDASCPPQ